MRWIAWLFYSASEERPRALVRIALSIVPLIVFMGGFAWAEEKLMQARGANTEAAFSDGALYMGSALAVLFALWLACRFLDRRPLDDLGFAITPGYGLDFGFGVVLGTALIAGVVAIEHAFGWAHYELLPAMAGEVPRLLYVPSTALAFLAVSLREEAISRGYHLRNLSEGFAIRWIPPRVAIALATAFSSVLFGLAHANNPSASAMSTGNIVLAGFMLAAGYVTTGRLAIPLGLHFSWNFTQNVVGMPVSGLDSFFYGSLLGREERGPDWITGGLFGPEAGATGLVAIVLGTFAILGWVRLRYGRLRLHEGLAHYAMPRVTIHAAHQAAITVESRAHPAD